MTEDIRGLSRILIGIFLYISVVITFLVSISLSNFVQLGLVGIAGIGILIGWWGILALCSSLDSGGCFRD